MPRKIISQRTLLRAGNLVNFKGLSLGLCTLLAACGSPDSEVENAAGAAANEVGAEAIASSSAADSDPYIWLEEVEGQRALTWAAQQNELSIPRLQGDPRYQQIRSDVEEILTAQDRIPYGSLIDGMVYNFWQDEEHVRGILRRASLASYITENPVWDTVLDIDALADVENANWVYKGRTCLPSDPTRCLLHLSDGGKDAVTVREYSLEQRNFVDGGFVVAEAKTNIDWVDENTLLVGTDFGEGSLTDSGYARSLRLWQRGTELADAGQVVEVDVGDMSVDAWGIESQERHYSFIQRRPDFFTEETWLFDGGNLGQLPLPLDANFRGMFADQAVVLLRSPWHLDDGRILAEGSLISLDLQASISNGEVTAARTILAPEGDELVDAIQSVSFTRDAIYISALKDVSGRLLRATQAGNGEWELSTISLPDNGAISISSADKSSDNLLVNYQSFLVPNSLYLIQNNGTPQLVKSLQPRFDASQYVTEQRFASSADGTQIPYFIVRGIDVPFDGSTAVEMTAYGGFEISRTPAYLGAMEQVWMDRGGAYVLANIRGGGEYGPQWHKTALLENRQRVFDDFIAVADDLIATGLTSSEHLGIRGGSNGGLLVTGVMVQRPDLYKAIISSVPLIDMLRYHKLLAGASWMAEYGNPDIPEHHAFISEYSPYQLVAEDEDYPEIFLWTNPKDDRVHPGHARKMAAKMLDQGHDVIYFENSEGGHGGGANLQQLAQTTAMQIVYFLQQLQ